MKLVMTLNILRKCEIDHDQTNANKSEYIFTIF